MKEAYLTGFHNYFQSESIKGALPQNQNSPKKPPFGLYSEQINNSAFTAPKSHNFNSWLYRIRPSAVHSAKAICISDHLIRDRHNKDSILTPPDQMRWHPKPGPKTQTDFISSITTMAYNSSAAIHLYHANQSMEDSFFYNADGDWLIVPQIGQLTFKTEMGILQVSKGEIAVIPRGIRYQVLADDQENYGYICEIQDGTFYLPERGPIGANGLAEERHFLTPSAHFEDRSGAFTLKCKFLGQLWQMAIKHSPLDVVAWHGNCAPYKYDLSLFTPINSVLKDHADPSIFTVLTAPSARVGTANVDFVIFPERWVVQENTFRPPYYHRNIMSEFMGLIFGQYDAKEIGFIPGGASLHNCMSGHGVDADTFNKAMACNNEPERYRDTLAFMFESNEVWQITEYALNASFRQDDYMDCWQGLKSNFNQKIK